MSDVEQFRVALDRAGRGPAGHPTRADIRLLSPDFYVEPDERFAWMRANAPVYWDDATGIWGLASHEAVRIASKEWQTFCSGQGSRPDSSVPSMINMDPPEHTFRRGIVKAGFTVAARRRPRAVPAPEGRRADRRRRRPRRVRHRRRHRHAAADVHDRHADGPPGVGPRPAAALVGPLRHRLRGRGARRSVQAVQDWNDYILAHAATVRGRGNEDLISLMCDAERDGRRLSDVDLMFETMLVLVGGDETTRHVISAGVDALLRHPDQLALLRADPQLHRRRRSRRCCAGRRR